MDRDKVTSQENLDESIEQEKLFLAKVGLGTLHLGIALGTIGIFLNQSTAGGLVFSLCLVFSMVLCACGGNNRVSTVTLGIDYVLFVLAGFGLMLAIAM